MKKDMTELPPEVQAQIRELETLPDDQIDTADAPEILDWSDARRGVFYRPGKAADYAAARRRHRSLVQGPCSRRPRVPDRHQRRPPRTPPENGPLGKLVRAPNAGKPGNRENKSATDVIFQLGPTLPVWELIKTCFHTLLFPQSNRVFALPSCLEILLFSGLRRCTFPTSVSHGSNGAVV